MEFKFYKTRVFSLDLIYICYRLGTYRLRAILLKEYVDIGL